MAHANLYKDNHQHRSEIKPASQIQISFAQAEFGKKKCTRREIFLEKMEPVVPWESLVEVLAPHYPKSGKRGRPPISLERMLRMYFVQQWYGLADEAVENAIYDLQALRTPSGNADNRITKEKPNASGGRDIGHIRFMFDNRHLKGKQDAI